MFSICLSLVCSIKGKETREYLGAHINEDVEISAREHTVRETDFDIFRMLSMKIGRSELMALAREVYEKPDFGRSKKPMRKKVETRLWNNLIEKFPDRDFTRGDEALTRAHIVRDLEPIFKCKYSYVVG